VETASAGPEVSNYLLRRVYIYILFVSAAEGPWMILLLFYITVFSPGKIRLTLGFLCLFLFLLLFFI
jgi:hypothetical protein